MRIVDLSIPLSDDVPADPPYMKPAIEYVEHDEGAGAIADAFPGGGGKRRRFAVTRTAENAKPFHGQAFSAARRASMSCVMSGSINGSRSPSMKLARL